MIIPGVLALICGLATPFLYRGLLRLSEGLPVSYQIAVSHICMVLALVAANLAVMAIYMLYDEAMIVIVPAFLIGAAIPKWR